MPESAPVAMATLPGTPDKDILEPEVHVSGESVFRVPTSTAPKVLVRPFRPVLPASQPPPGLPPRQQLLQAAQQALGNKGQVLNPSTLEFVRVSYTPTILTAGNALGAGKAR